MYLGWERLKVQSVGGSKSILYLVQQFKHIITLFCIMNSVLSAPVAHSIYFQSYRTLIRILALKLAKCTTFNAVKIGAQVLAIKNF